MLHGESCLLLTVLKSWPPLSHPTDGTAPTLIVLTARNWRSPASPCLHVLTTGTGNPASAMIATPAGYALPSTLAQT